MVNPSDSNLFLYLGMTIKNKKINSLRSDIPNVLPYKMANSGLWEMHELPW